MADDPALLAAGRASDIFDLGNGRVLRRFKRGGDAELEALVMRHARTHGFAVPRILEVRADALVLERIEGRTMTATLRRRPWLFPHHAAQLAHLHEKLHRIPAPPGLSVVGSGDRLLHLDLHPDNVILSPAGPVVIDWANAHQGEPPLDVALTWVILATSGGRAGRLFLHWFLRHVDREAAGQALPDAVAFRLADPNVTDAERARVRRLLRGQARSQPRAA